MYKHKTDKTTSDLAVDSVSAGSRSRVDEMALYHGYKKLCKIEKMANANGMQDIAAEAHHGGVHLGIILGLDAIERLDADGELAAKAARKVFSENSRAGASEGNGG